MKNLGVVITDGVGFRNFILTNFIVEAKSNFDRIVILSCLPYSVYENFDLNCEIIELDVFTESFRTWFYRKAKEVAHLQLHRKNNFGIQDNFNSNKTNSKSNRGHATRFIYKFTNFFHSEKWILRYNSWQQKSFKNHPVTVNYSKTLADKKISSLFFTHQRPPFIAPLILVAEQLKINTTAFIFSWDNLASKGRMAGNFNNYLVWSDLMKKELLHFYQSVNENQVEVIGTPQFEPYVLERYKVSYQEFVSKFEINPNLKTICFSCGDIATSKNDELYIETIANAIQSSLIQNVNFIIRTSPAEDPIRFIKLKEKYSFIEWNYPDWKLSRQTHQEEWSQRIPSINDLKDLRSLLEFSDLNINMLSTMSLDFMQFDKPVINTVFGNNENGLYNDQRFLKYAHIANVVNSKSTKITKNANELIVAINSYLSNPLLDSENRKNLLKMQVSKPLLETGKRIVECLYEKQ